MISFQDSSSVEGDCIASVDLEVNLFDDISEDNFSYFQRLCGNFEDKNLLWLMPLAQVNCVNPRGSQSLGMIRTARSELDLSITTLEIDSSIPDFVKFVIDIFQKVISWKDYSTLAPDREFVVHRNLVKVGRYRPFNLYHEFRHDPKVHENSLRTTEHLKTRCYEGSSSLSKFPTESIGVDFHANGFSLEVSNMCLLY